VPLKRFFANEMSEWPIEHTIKDLLECLMDNFNAYLISDSRDISMGSFNLKADTLAHQETKYAVLSGLIDDVVSFDDIEFKIKKGIEKSRIDKDITMLPYGLQLGQPTG